MGRRSQPAQLRRSYWKLVQHMATQQAHLRGPLASLTNNLLGQESGGAGSTTYW